MMEPSSPERTLVRGTASGLLSLLRQRWLPATAVLGLLIVGTGISWAIQARQPAVLESGGLRLVAESPARTGSQRAERLCFADRGRLLAVACPRYGRVVLYRIEPEGTPERLADIETGGRPVAVEASDHGVLALVRPAGDARHLEPAWLQAYDLDGQPVGSKFRVGWDPDDMALMPDGRTLLVLLSGRAEGETNRPAPSLVAIDLGDSIHPRLRGEVAFDQPGDDPERLALAEDGTVGVTLRGSNVMALVDFSDPDQPRLVARASSPNGGNLTPISIQQDRGFLVTNLTEGTVHALEYGRNGPDQTSEETQGMSLLPFRKRIGEIIVLEGPVPLVIGGVPDGSALEILEQSGRSWGVLPLRGAFGFGGVIPMGMAAWNDGSEARIAVADRSGGVHLVRLQIENPDSIP